MATQWKNEGLRKVLAAYLASGADVRIALLSSNTTVDTENDGIAFVDEYTLLDEFDGANYVRKVLASEAVSKDDAGDRAEYDAADVTWTALGAGTRSIVGIAVIEHVTNDTDSTVIAWLEFAAPKTPDGSDFTVQWDAEGILQLKLP
jgi:hypothetical protein